MAGGGVVCSTVRSAKCQDFQFDSLNKNNNNNKNFYLNRGSFHIIPRIRFNWELLEEPRYVLSAKGIRFYI